MQSGPVTIPAMVSCVAVGNTLKKTPNTKSNTLYAIVRMVMRFLLRYAECGQSLGSRSLMFSPLRPYGRAFDLVEHFLVLGKTPDVMLAPDLFAVDMDVKNAARPLDQRRINAVGLLDRSR